jgi:hypothetical protein
VIKDEAIRVLEKAIEERHSLLTYSKQNPLRKPAFPPALEGDVPPREFPGRVAQPMMAEDALLVLTARIWLRCQ